MLMEDCLREFMFDCKLRKLSVRTIKSYHNNLLRMFKFIQSELKVSKLDEITPRCIQMYIEYLTKQGLKENYINGIIKCARAFFVYAGAEEYISKDIMKKIKWQREEIPMIETFTYEEVTKMISYYTGNRFLDVRNRLLMIVLFDTGIRNTELCEIRLEDVRETFIVIHGKGKKIRHVPITSIINKYLIKYLRVREAYIVDKVAYQTDYLFLSQKGRKLTVESVERIVATCGESCEIRETVRCSPHTCRHYYAQTQLKNGCDLFTVSRLLGHTNINITKRYLQSMHSEDIMAAAVRTSPLGNL